MGEATGDRDTRQWHVVSVPAVAAWERGRQSMVVPDGGSDLGQSWDAVADALGEGIGLVEVVRGGDGRPADLRLLRANARLRARLGLPQDGTGDLVGALGPDWARCADRALATDEPVRFPVATARASGRRCEARFRLIGDAVAGRLALSIHDAGTLHDQFAPIDDTFLSLFDSIDSGFCLVTAIRDDAGTLVDVRIRAINRAFRTMTGYAGDTPVGLTLRQILPAVEDVWITQLATAMDTGEASRREGLVSAIGRWYENRIVPQGGDLAAVLLADVSERHRDDEELRTSDNRQRFLLELNDRLRPLTDPGEVMRQAARLLAARLGVSAVGYALVGEDGDSVRTGGEYGDGRMPSLEGFSGRLSDFGPGLGPALLAGQSVFTGDIRDADDWEPGGSEAAAERNLGTAAMIPLTRDGRLAAYLYAADPEPRRWSEDDRIVMREVATRTWAAVEMTHAAAKLRASEERFRTLIQHGADVILILDADGLLQYASDSTATILGYRPDAVDGLDSQSFVHPDDLPVVQAWFIDLAGRPGAVGRTRYRVRHRDGHYVWLEATISNHLETPGIGGMVGNFRDISDRLRSDEALRAEEERYRALFDSMDQGFCTIEMIFDDQGNPVDYRFLEINPAFARQTGLIDALGRRMRELIPNHEQYWFDVYGRVALTGEPIRFEQESAVLGRWFSLYAYRIDRPESRRVAVLFEDITARKHDEQEQLQARQLAERAVVARDRFLSIGAHELRTPITGIKGSAELLLRSVRRGNLDQARLERYATNLLESTDRMAALVNDLFDVARLQSTEVGQLETRRQPTDLADLVRTTLRAPHLDRSRHRLVLDVAAGDPVDVDPDRIGQVIVNLVDNALKYSPDGGQVVVSLAREPAGATLRVRDTGIGLPSEALETIFEPFNRATNAAASSIPGLGLGLYICREIAEAHEGRLWAESDGVGTGTTMSLWLPAGHQLADEASL